MWINSNFLDLVNETLEDIINDENIEFENRFKDYKAKKYFSVVRIVKKLNKKKLENDIFIEHLSNIIEELSQGNFAKLNKMNDDRLSKFFLKLNDILNKFILDSNMMSNYSKEGKLDIRIDETQYFGDFKKIVHGMNKTMESTVVALREIGTFLKRLSNGEKNAKITNDYKGDYNLLKIECNNLSQILTENRIENEKQVWFQSGIAKLNEELLGENTTFEIANKSITFLGNYLNIGAGVLYLYDEANKILREESSYAFIQREEFRNSFKLGEGIVGQVGLQKKAIQLKNINRSSFLINTGTTSEPPLNTYTFPLIFNKNLYGVIELASHELFTENERNFLNTASEIIAIAIFTSIQNEKVKILLEETNQKNMEIEKANTILEEQQQQLEEANTQLEEQQQILKEKNDILKQSEKELDEKAKELEVSGKYKSEFLANMSHELRTPLNSIILLSDLLRENKNGNLTEEDIQKARIINKSGNELLRLINDVLDLSKVEAGKMELIIDKIDSKTLCQDFEDTFKYNTIDKGLELKVIDEYQGVIYTDKDKLFQIIKNLTSNALKFTKEGSITLKISKADEKNIKISIIDTGIGIEEDKQKAVFEAFQQADGGTSREYGGTGLGLSISKKFVELMNGKFELKSEFGKGSEFSVIIPISLDKNYVLEKQEENIKNENNVISKKEKIEKIDDDRDIITRLDKPYLIIEDDENLAKLLKDKINERKEYALISHTGLEALELTKQYDIKGILLDLGLPDIDGIELLKELKTHHKFRKIPVFVISGQDKEKLAKDNGAIGFTNKPIDKMGISLALNSIDIFNNKTIKTLLIVEPDELKREKMLKTIGDDSSIKTFAVSSVESAENNLKNSRYDGILVDITSDINIALSIGRYMKEHKIKIPFIVCTKNELSEDEKVKLKTYANSIVTNSNGIDDTLIDKIDIFMHRINLSNANNKKVLSKNKNLGLKNKKILIVDDDIRNLYVLSAALNSRDAIVITANNGEEAIKSLEENSDIELILMDVMMPKMDGYEATKIIKSNPKTRNIPIIALTAKLEKNEREKALDAGCDDYIAKPIKMDVLISIIEGWLNK